MHFLYNILWYVYEYGVCEVVCLLGRKTLKDDVGEV